MFKILVVLAICLSAFSAVKDQIIKLTVAAVGSAVTGTRIDIKNFSFSFLKQEVRIGGLVMHQPKESPEKGTMVELPAVNVDYDLGAMLKGKVHLYSAGISLKQIILVKDKNGKLNVDYLKVSGKQEAGKPKGKQPSMQIDELKLDIGRLVSEDFSHGDEPFIEVYDMHIKKTYHNITSPQQLVLYILTEPMKAAGIKGAAIYGIATLAGTAILPVAAAAVFVGKDSVSQEFGVGFEKAYAASIDALGRSGKIKRQDKASGVISADIKGTDVSLEVKHLAGKSRISVSARKLMVPRPEIAAGILYKVEKRLE